MFQAHRYHDISCGHRVCGHESKCAHLHGHNYRIHFTIIPKNTVVPMFPNNEEPLDDVGRVLDFAVIKKLLCQWLEDNWDHKFLIYSKDPMAEPLSKLDEKGVLIVPFNPTAEKMAEYLVDIIGPEVLAEEDVYLSKVVVEETMKCSVTYSRKF